MQSWEIDKLEILLKVPRSWRNFDGLVRQLRFLLREKNLTQVISVGVTSDKPESYKNLAVLPVTKTWHSKLTSFLEILNLVHFGWFEIFLLWKQKSKKEDKEAFFGKVNFTQKKFQFVAVYLVIIIYLNWLKLIQKYFCYAGEIYFTIKLATLYNHF